jgi:hypothetical protein
MIRLLVSFTAMIALLSGMDWHFFGRKMADKWFWRRRCKVLFKCKTDHLLRCKTIGFPGVYSGTGIRTPIF